MEGLEFYMDYINERHNDQDLPETFVIFITEKDQFADGKPCHRIERVDMDTEGHPMFDDGEHILYVNGSFEGESDIGKLMHDFRCCDPKDMYFKEMQEVTHHYKETEEGVEFMCRAFEETRDSAKYQEKIDTAKRLIDMGDLSLEKIAVACGLPLEKVQELAGTKTA